MNTFYLPELAEGGIALSDAERKHCTQVLRHQEGDTIRLVDGKGHAAEARITGVDKRMLHLHIGAVRREARDPAVCLHLAIAPPKNTTRFEWLLEKATEIGVRRITPLVSQRSERRKGRFDRWEKVLVAAMKQSGRSWLPELAEATPLSALLESAEEHGRYIAHCGEGRRVPLWQALVPKMDAVVCIGPEGDFSAQELAQAKAAHFVPVSLGDARLRTETAGLVALQWMNLAQEEAFRKA